MKHIVLSILMLLCLCSWQSSSYTAQIALEQKTKKKSTKTSKKGKKEDIGNQDIPLIATSNEDNTTTDIEIEPNAINATPQIEMTTTYTSGEDNKIYTNPEVKAGYLGGLQEFNKHFLADFRVPVVDNDVSKIRLIVQFVVEKDSTLTDIKIMRDPGYGAGKEALRVLKTMNKWIPAQDKGVNVRSRFTLPITVELKLEEVQSEKPLLLVGMPPENKVDYTNDTIYTAVTVGPEYPGGMQAFTKTFLSRFRKPDVDIDLKQTEVILSLTFDQDGVITKIVILKDPGYGIGIEANRVVAAMSKWKPAFLDEKPVRYQLTLPITISLE